MEPTSIRSAPPPYTSTLPDLDFASQGQHSQAPTAQQQQTVQQPQQAAPQQPPKHHHAALQQPQQPHHFVPQYQVQHSPWPQGYIPQPQPQPQPFYYQNPPQSFVVPVPIYPIPGPVFYHPSPYPAPYYQQVFPQPNPIHPPPQITYQPQPLLPPFQFSATQPSAPTIQQQAQPLTSGMQIIQSANQTGFVPHPPALIPGIPGVHQYPLIVRKEGEGPPPEPVFVDGFAAFKTGEQSPGARG